VLARERSFKGKKGEKKEGKAVVIEGQR